MSIAVTVDASSLQVPFVQRNPLTDSLLDVFNGIPITESNCQRNSRVAMKVVAVAASGLTKAFFWNASKGVGDGVVGEGWVPYAVGNVIGWGMFECWGAWDIIDDLTQAQGRNEVILFQNTAQSTCRRIAIISSAFAVAILSQIPNGFMAYKYNSDPIDKVAFVVTVLAGSFYPTRSLQLTFSAASQARMLGEVENALSCIQNEIADHIDNHRKLFEEMGIQDKLLKIQEYAQLGIAHLDEGKINAFIELILSSPENVRPQVSRATRVVDGLSRISGCFFTAVLQTGYAFYSYSYAPSRQAGSIVFSAAVGAAGSYLTYQSIKSTTFALLSPLFNCKREPTIGAQLYPSTSFAAKVIGGLASYFGQGALYVIMRDYFNEDPSNIFGAHNESTGKFYRYSVCTASFLLLFTASLHIADGAIEAHIKRNGSKAHKDILQLRDNMRKLSNLMRHSPFMPFAQAFSGWPEAVTSALMRKFNLIKAKLDGYLGINDPNSQAADPNASPANARRIQLVEVS